MKNHILILISLVFLSGCDLAKIAFEGAPLFSSSVIDRDTFQENIRIVRSEYVLREGNYCAYLIAEGYEKLTRTEMEEMFGGELSVSYELIIPALNMKEAVDLGKFPDALSGYNYSNDYFFKTVPVSIDHLQKPRTGVYLTAFFSAKEELLANSRFKIMFSDWACK
ncbi:hypothetical protein A3197_05575 [Candidatus Thiodiazotropha endoloripes]|nr:hypothetical protein A3197_05575 [Candidatus Thiodiazotropha endoloripes]